MTRKTRRGRKMTPAMLERALLLLREKLPPLWIAEDVGVERSTIAKIRAMHGIEPDKEWAGIQLSIRKDDRLAPFHAEIAPTKLHT